MGPTPASHASRTTSSRAAISCRGRTSTKTSDQEPSSEAFPNRTASGRAYLSALSATHVGSVRRPPDFTGRPKSIDLKPRDVRLDAASGGPPPALRGQHLRPKSAADPPVSFFSPKRLAFRSGDVGGAVLSAVFRARRVILVPTRARLPRARPGQSGVGKRELGSPHAPYSGMRSAD